MFMHCIRKATGLAKVHNCSLALSILVVTYSPSPLMNLTDTVCFTQSPSMGFEQYFTR